MPVVEYEAKYLDVDPAAMASRIALAGGEHKGGRMMRRYVYYTVPPAAGRWVRLRDDGSLTTLCVKEITSDAIDGTSETETVVGDFETTHALLGRMGVPHRSYQENHRDSWVLDGVRLEIDSWPLIPPYLEIEGDCVEDVHGVAARLSIAVPELTSENTTKVFARYGIDLERISDLRFP
ncbi:adenylate cyclase [Streptomyces sp. MBT67]|uniref:adenylate cyclase n=1 Tax=unclassified Streptomyces TaxID=2593676 RepID=UPI001909F6FF|nr:MULTISPECIES: adenylate cyclase [unclassified Streptomyces]MBK3529546.1 adenylate cyclase [Streptomyces sp. MBT72]MBK3539664.1 adenylate cyclase [Streptomyces sp. MBT67]MBK3552099.1 adenylate cyclase [Streptomyces sp. MBT61]MBK6029327.1 adenylate cyclase [Streptomyces sp. MBT59]